MTFAAGNCRHRRNRRQPAPHVYGLPMFGPLRLSSRDSWRVTDVRKLALSWREQAFACAEVSNSRIVGQLAVGPETIFEEIGAQAALLNTRFPPTRLLDSLYCQHPVWVC